MRTVLCADPMPPPILDAIRATLLPEIAFDAVVNASDEDFAARAADAEVLLVVFRQVNVRLLSLAPRLRFVQIAKVGYDNVDLDAVARAGIHVAYTPGANAGAVAEHTILLMLALVKRFVAAEAATRANEWNQHALLGGGIGDLAGATVGLVGFGAIGQALAARLGPFGARVVYTARRPVDAALAAQLHAEYRTLPELLAESDLVSVQVPLTNETQGLIGAREFAAMKRGAMLVNVARGGVLDEVALHDAVVSGQIAGAACDVLVHEGVGGNPFTDLPQVLVTPHIAGASRAGVAAIVRMAMANVNRYLAGETPHGLVPLPLRSDHAAITAGRG